jgi:hypothetical protein
MSMPTSFIASTTAGLTVSVGADPADRTATRSPPRWLRKAAAICERPALWTQTNSTDGLALVSDMGRTFRGGGRLGRERGCVGEEAAGGEGYMDQADEHRHLDERTGDPGQGLP